MFLRDSFECICFQQVNQLNISSILNHPIDKTAARRLSGAVHFYQHCTNEPQALSLTKSTRLSGTYAHDLCPTRPSGLVQRLYYTTRTRIKHYRSRSICASPPNRCTKWLLSIDFSSMPFIDRFFQSMTFIDPFSQSLPFIDRFFQLMPFIDRFF